MVKWLKHHQGYLDDDLPKSRRDLFRKAGEEKLLRDSAVWFLFHEKRNLTVHAYDPLKAQEVFNTIPLFLEEVQFLMNQLGRKND